MTLIVDAAPLIALMNTEDPSGEVVGRVLLHEPGRFVVPAPVTAEVDYFVRRRFGRAARRHS